MYDATHADFAYPNSLPSQGNDLFFGKQTYHIVYYHFLTGKTLTISPTIPTAAAYTPSSAGPTRLKQE
jgi:hypothetical protein